MNTLDIIMIILILISTMNGLRQGFIHALANLIGWVFALICATKFSEYMRPLMGFISQDQTVQHIAAFIAIVLAVVILTWTLGYLLHQVIKKLKLSWFNRLAGGAFGFAKMAVVFLVAIHILQGWVAQTKMWQDSKMIGWLQPYVAQTIEYSQQIVQKTTAELESFNSDDHSKAQDDIISPSNGENQSKTANPFL
uniref:CvpA family protein n=1 Tax=uncultured Acinetobacter sp. TaxID=165433 RepID=UPI0026362EC6|nr:CvpA family protein [uncultured Acinetobacter sp.]